MTDIDFTHDGITYSGRLDEMTDLQLDNAYSAVHDYVDALSDARDQIEYARSAVDEARDFLRHTDEAESYALGAADEQLAQAYDSIDSRYDEVSETGTDIEDERERRTATATHRLVALLHEDNVDRIVELGTVDGLEADDNAAVLAQLPAVEVQVQTIAHQSGETTRKLTVLKTGSESPDIVWPAVKTVGQIGTWEENPHLGLTDA